MAMWQIREQISEEAGAYGLDPASVTSRLMYGVGTRLISSHGYPALGGVYKLVGIDEGGTWTPAIKISDSPEKMPIPGDKQLWRVYDDRGLATADVVSGGGEVVHPGEALRVFHPHRSGMSRQLTPSETVEVESMLTQVYDQGTRTDGSPDLETLRKRRLSDLDRLDVGVRRLINPHRYHVSVTGQVKDIQNDLVARARS
jgi:nicotinate phosphoribosyltransferase